MERDDPPFPSESHLPFPMIETLVLRPPGPPKQTGDNLTCAYVKLRTSIGRRKAAQKIMLTLQTLTRLVLIVHKHDYRIPKGPTDW